MDPRKSHSYQYLILFYLTIVLSAVVSAQTVNLGDDVSRPIPGAGHDYVHGLSETVNPANGNVHIHIDLPVPRGRGLTLPFAITYDSGEPYHASSFFPGTGWFGVPLQEPGDLAQAGNGWSNTLPYVSATGFAVGVPMAPYYSNTAFQCPMSSSYNFYDPNGESHMLGLAAIGIGVAVQNVPQPQQACNGLTYNGIGYAYYTLGGDDQVYGQMDAACDGNYQGVDYPTDCQYASPAFTVTDMNGTVYMFQTNNIASRVGATPGSGISVMFPAQIEDRNGNIINFTPVNGSSYGLPITDTAGRPLISATCGGFYCSTPTTYTVGGFTYTLQYQNTGSANFGVSSLQIGDVAHLSGDCIFSGAVVYANEQVLRSITLPNGQSYTFGYDGTYGLLNSITYPDGGWVKYFWGLTPDYSAVTSFHPGGTVTSGNGCEYEYQTPVITERQIGYSAGSGPAQTQTFAYRTNWIGTTGVWSTKTTSVVSTDNVTGVISTTNYTYGSVNQPYQPDSSDQLVAQLPVENTIQYLDGNNNVLKTVTKTWADQFEMTSETTTVPNVGSYGVAYCYFASDCTKPTQNYLGDQPIAKYEYDFGQVPSVMPPASVSGPGAATRSTVYGYYGITLPCHFTAPITYQTNPVPCPIGSSQKKSIGNRQAGPPLKLAQIVTYAGSAVYNFNTNTWSGTRIAETDAHYDGQTSFGGGITGTGNSVGGLPPGTHDETNYGAGSAIARGNPTTVIKWLSTGTSPRTTYTFDETGQVRSKVDGCGNSTCADMGPNERNHTTTYSYLDSPSGGNPYGNSNAYLTQINYPTPGDGVSQQESFSYNYSMGDLASAKDRNGQITNYTYNDALDRLTEIDYPDTGKTTYSYNDSVPSITTSTLLNTSGAWKRTVDIMDGMRQVIQTQLTTDPGGTDFVDTSYDGEGRVWRQSNPHRSASLPTDGTTVHAYDPLGRQIQLVHPDGSSQQWCYNGLAPATGIYCSGHQGSVNGSWVDFTDEDANHWQRTSDSLGRLTELMEPSGTSQTVSLETDYSYDMLDNLVSVNQRGKVGTDTARPLRTFTYDSLSRLVQAYNPENGWVCFGTTGGMPANGGNCASGYDTNSNAGAKTDSRGVTITYTYDALNRTLGKTYSDTTLPVSYIYDSSSISGAAYTVGRLTSASVISGANLVAWRAPYKYDAMGRLQNEQQCTPANCTGAAYTPAYTYDLAGSVSTALAGLPSSVSGLPSTSMQLSYGYDGAERLSTITSNITESQNYPSILFQANTPASYGPIGLMNAQLGVNSTTNLPLLSLSRTYDNRGRSLSETDQVPATGSTGSITLSGSEQSGTPGSATIGISQMPAGPDSGVFTVTVGSIQRPVHWSYGTGGMSTSAFASLIASSFSSNTLVSVTSAGSGVTFTSYLVGPGSNYSLSVSQSSSNGKLVSYSAPSSLSGGRTPGSTYDSGTAFATINGNKATVSWGQGSTVTTIASALASAIGTSDSGILTATASGGTISLSSLQQGSGTDWTITTGITHDSTNFSSPSFSISSSGMSGGGGGTVYSYSIASGGGYDPVGNVKSVTDSVIGQWTYSYDTLNRLLTGTAASGPYSGYKGCWAYDSFGNRTSESFQTSACPTPETTVPATATYNANSQITWTSVNGAVNGLTYDSAGNVLNDNSNSYLYDAEGRLCAVKNVTGSITEYVYDAAGRRVGKGTLSNWPSACVAPTAANGFTLNASYVLGLGGEQVSELSISGSTSMWLHTNIFGAGQLLATYHDTTTHFALDDWLGTKRAEYTTSGLYSTFFSLPYGNGLVSSGSASDATEHHFTGKERDAESGLDYFGARYNASSLGRMMTPDSGVDQHPEDPQSWNLYAYGRNNPLIMVDPTGEYICGSGVTQTMCDNFQKELDAAQQGANALKNGADSTQYKDAQRAIDAYGKEGVDNGVTLSLKEPKPGDGGGVDRNIGTAPKTADNPLGIRINVSFGKDMFSGSAENAPDAAHEGSHVADGQDWARSGFAPSMNPTRYGSEFRAFHVGASIAEGTGWPYYGAILGKQQIYYWKPGWTPAQVNSGINQVLSSPAGHYHLTPNSKILAFQHNTKGGN